MPLSLGAATPPSWVLQGALFDFDFCKSRNWGGGGITAQTFFDKLSFAADGGAYVANSFTPTASGVLYQSSGPNQQRITNLGFFQERASTNFCYYSRDLTQSAASYWTAITTMTTAKTAVGADGVTNGGTTLTATGNNASIYQTVTPNSRIYSAAIAVAGTGYVANETVTLSTATGTASITGKVRVLTVSGGIPQTITVQTPGAYTVAPTNPVAQGSTTGSGVGLTVNLTFENFVFGAWVKRRTGSGAIYMTTNGGGATYQIDGLINSTKYTWITGMAQTNGANTYQCGFQIATSGDAIDVDFCQFEPVAATNTNGTIITVENPTGGMPTTPLPNTTTGAGFAARGNNTSYWQNAAVVGTGPNLGALILNMFSNGGPWSMVMSFNGDCTNNVVNGPTIIASDMACPTQVSGGGGGTCGVGGAAQTANTGNNGRGNWNVVAIRCSGAGTYVCLNGGAVAGPRTGVGYVPNVNAGCTHFNIGNNGSGTNDTQLNGSIGRVTWLNKELTDAEMIAYTTLSYGYGQP